MQARVRVVDDRRGVNAKALSTYMGHTSITTGTGT
jgi:hypothetical protein